MPTIQFTFPGGRYHATPWGHHTNEGLVEWPPCPWRLLRALLACGFTKQLWTEVPPVGQQLFAKLAEVSPTYELPKASVAHSRHYMPYIEGPKQNTTLVFDSWANIGNQSLLVHWPCQLGPEETELMQQLVTDLGYLGRSESWVEASLLEDSDRQWNAFPCLGDQHPGPGWEQVSLMSPLSVDTYQNWYQQETQKILADYPLPEGSKKPTAKVLKERDNAIAPYPRDLISCLTKDTAWWKGYNWSQPPGSKLVLYWRKTGGLQGGTVQRKATPDRMSVSMILLALTTPSGNTSALPQRTRVLPQAELLHRTLVSRVGRGQKVDCPEITGRDEQGNPLNSGHEHAHTIPLDLDADGKLDHILIYAKMGLGSRAQRAIRSLRTTWMKGGVGELQVAVVGSGELELLRNLPDPLSWQIKSFLGPKEGSLIWESLTPFVPPQTVDKRPRRSIQSQVNAELERRGLPTAKSIEILDDLSKGFRHYVTTRTRGGKSPNTPVALGLRLTFAEPVCGPLLLGYASHFGLGVFRAL